VGIVNKNNAEFEIITDKLRGNHEFQRINCLKLSHFWTNYSGIFSKKQGISVLFVYLCRAQMSTVQEKMQQEPGSAAPRNLPVKITGGNL